ncbi:MAG TPA: MoaD/ThiS family protein [Gammaproteobacteria bacterium]|nr:MoaD/ThiS family protein [Gammaproteobacteria bacterium]
MSRVTVRIPAALRPFVEGARELELDVATVGDALTQIGGRHDHFLPRILTPAGELRPFVNVFVGATNVRHLQGLATPVADGVEISIIPAVAGG